MSACRSGTCGQCELCLGRKTVREHDEREAAKRQVEIDAARAEERAAIVEWLRREASIAERAGQNKAVDAIGSLIVLADAIERGKHRMTR